MAYTLKKGDTVLLKKTSKFWGQSKDTTGKVCEVSCSDGWIGVEWKDGSRNAYPVEDLKPVKKKL